MKEFFKISNIYIFLWCIYSLQGTLYASGSIISQGILAILLAISLFYAFQVNFTMQVSSAIKMLNILLVMFTAYGALYMMSGVVHIADGGLAVGAVGYLKSIYISLLPIYPFYVFTKRGELTERVIRKWFFVFIVIVTVLYWRMQRELLQKAVMEGSLSEEFTNNSAYLFLSLLPLIFFFKEKKLVQYAALAYIMAFIIIGMKRGAMLIGGLTTLWFMYRTFKTSSPKVRFRVLFLTVLILVAGGFYIMHMYETSDYFQHRFEQTQEGSSSGRDTIYSSLLSYFINESSAWQFFLGHGANYTVVVAGNYAHNDWLELAINQGCLGIFIYLLYWIFMYKTWRTTRSNTTIYSAMGAILLIFFLATFFSMSYNDLSIYATLCLGYCLAQTGYSSKMINI